MKVRTFIDISVDKFLEISEKELPIYGNFLKFYKTELDLLPLNIGTPLLRVGHFYEKLEKMRRGMLYAHIELAMLKKGFVSFSDLEAGLSVPDLLERYIPEDINFYICGEEELSSEILPSDYINTGNLKEGIRVLILCANLDPSFEEDKITISTYCSEGGADDLIGILNKELPPIEHLSKFIIIDPFLFSAIKDEVTALKQEIGEKIGRDIVYHPSDFLNVLAIEREEFDKEWSELYSHSLKYLKGKYKFLALFEERRIIYDVQENIRKAELNMRKREYEEVAWRTGNACEGMLRILYHMYKRKEPEEKGFGFLLEGLRREIHTEFGNDVLNDLEYIKEWRNIADHPTQREITFEVAAKVIKKTQLFQELFFNKIKGGLIE